MLFPSKRGQAKCLSSMALIFLFQFGSDFLLYPLLKMKNLLFEASSFGVMFAVNISMLSVTNFCHFLFYNLVKNLLRFILVVSAICHRFYRYFTIFFFEDTIGEVIRLS